MNTESTEALNMYKTRVAYLEGEMRKNFEFINQLMSNAAKKSLADTTSELIIDPRNLANNLINNCDIKGNN